MSTNWTHPLERQTVNQAFISYLVPSVLGMLVIAFNFIIDGIMVGHKLGSTAMAGIGIASPVYTLFVAMSLWIGMGGATLYSNHMGRKEHKKAKEVFTKSIILIALITMAIGYTAYTFKDKLVYTLGANADTFPFAADYMNIMLLFGFVFTIENALSVFVRNDGGPNTSMYAQITFAVANIVINYITLYVLEWGVRGVALGTIVSAALALLVLFSHFFKKSNNLTFTRFTWSTKLLWMIALIGFPSFLAELGMSVFSVSHNISMERIEGTDGVASFTVLNYIHGVVLMAFLGLASAAQPLISYYHGAQRVKRVQETIRIAVKTALTCGLVLLLIVQVGASYFVQIFGNFSNSVTDSAVYGLRIFTIAYVFMGVNFVMSTYFQSIGNAKMAIWITAAREMIIMIALIAILPSFLGVTGVWLAVPLSEMLVLITIALYYRKRSLTERLNLLQAK
ncbi:putative MATE family efflux protein [Paenibacillus sp. 4624]|jgi:putative MATE family efflux protein|uniref:Multidrug export protein MepA n=1 Tax=Paenibacillus amylolyticus TaxID=1451 RepID=A0A5M9X0I8_PAEAM|nr:MATE family efflux transporter [Paenibacillus amylolyticus]KAA8787123.1 MATE family efflux transporter [Paenibacillus amylolyticus]